MWFADCKKDYFTLALPVSVLQYTFPHIKTPLFVLNSAYDTWQLPNILQFNCKNLSTCPEAEKEAFYNYRNVSAVLGEGRVAGVGRKLVFRFSCVSQLSSYISTRTRLYWAIYNHNTRLYLLYALRVVK